MRYKDLKEMTIKDWDGKAYECVFCDDIEDEVPKDIDNYRGVVVLYDCRQAFPWMTATQLNWGHAYPISWNKDKLFDILFPEDTSVYKSN